MQNFTWKAELHLKREIPLILPCTRQPFLYWKLFFWGRIPVRNFWQVPTHIGEQSKKLASLLPTHNLLGHIQGPYRICSTSCACTMGGWLWNTRKSHPASHKEGGGAGDPKVAKEPPGTITALDPWTEIVCITKVDSYSTCSCCLWFFFL